MSITTGRKSQELPDNKGLAAQAIRQVKSAGTDSSDGMCQKMIREAVQDEYGDRYDDYHKGTAEASRRAWVAGGFGIDPTNGSVVGDILYKAPTARVPAGHVGIRVSGNRVAENSSTTVGRVRGAYGYRSLDEFGSVKTIVRLPDGK